jgi:predicted TIM-barrel fold metal-dependent hydrolase
MVLDTHTHAWGPPTRDHPWVNGPLVEEFVTGFSVDPVYRAEDLLADMDENGIDEAAVVGYPICEWTDNWYTLEAVRDHGRLRGIVMVDQFADGAAGRLREHMAVDGIDGFRLGAACPYDRMWEGFDPTTTWLLDAIEETAFFEAARATDALVQVLVTTDQLDQAVELVETYPELTYAFDHFAHADPDVPPGEGGFAAFETLASYDVAVKVSEVPHVSGAGFPYEDMHDHVRWLLETFGRERVVWGSDFPNVSDVASYEQSLHWLDHVDVLSEADRTWLTERAYRDLTGS